MTYNYDLSVPKISTTSSFHYGTPNDIEYGSYVLCVSIVESNGDSTHIWSLSHETIVVILKLTISLNNHCH